MTSETNPHGRNDPLLLAGRILTILMQAVMVIGCVALAIVMPVMIVFRDSINAEIAADHADLVGSFPAFPIAGIMFIGIGVLMLAFKFFGKLRQIINSVGDGDPFAPENADRLSSMGWIMVGIYALSALAAAVAATIVDWAEQIETIDISFAAGFDLSSILMIILLFILARVFRHGAAMRDDLEGTV